MKLRIKESEYAFTTDDDFGISADFDESEESQLRKMLDAFISDNTVNDQRYGSWKVRFEDDKREPNLAMTISYYGDVVCKMYYDSVKGYTLNCKRVPDLDFDIKSAIKDVFDEHGIIVERFGRSTNKESTLKEDYKNDLKKFVDANFDEFKTIGAKCGYRLYSDTYYTKSHVDGEYISVICIDCSPIDYRKDNLGKFERLLNKFFKNFDFRFYLQEIYSKGNLGEVRLCIYY
jgi:hypothetical protein